MNNTQKEYIFYYEISHPVQPTIKRRIAWMASLLYENTTIMPSVSVGEITSGAKDGELGMSIKVNCDHECQSFERALKNFSKALESIRHDFPPKKSWNSPLRNISPSKKKVKKFDHFATEERRITVEPISEDVQELLYNVGSEFSHLSPASKARTSCQFSSKLKNDHTWRNDFQELRSDPLPKILESVLRYMKGSNSVKTIQVVENGRRTFTVKVSISETDPSQWRTRNHPMKILHDNISETFEVNPFLIGRFRDSASQKLCCSWDDIRDRAEYEYTLLDPGNAFLRDNIYLTHHTCSKPGKLVPEDATIDLPSIPGSVTYQYAQQENDSSFSINTFCPNGRSSVSGFSFREIIFLAITTIGVVGALSGFCVIGIASVLIFANPFTASVIGIASVLIFADPTTVTKLIVGATTVTKLIVGATFVGATVVFIAVLITIYNLYVLF